MGCNCKRAIEIEDKYGVREEEAKLNFIGRMLLRGFMFLLLILLSIVIVPIMLLIVVYKITFGKDNKITLPKILNKYLENG